MALDQVWPGGCNDGQRDRDPNRRGHRHRCHRRVRTVLEERDGTLVVRAAGIMVQPFMQGGACGEDGEQHDQRDATAGQQSADQRRKRARAMLQENHDAGWQKLICRCGWTASEVPGFSGP